MTVFFRGGLEEYPLTGGCDSASGGGVTTGGGLAEPPVGGKKPCIVCRGAGRLVGVLMTPPGLTEGLACDERRFGGATDGGVSRGGRGSGFGVTKARAC